MFRNTYLHELDTSQSTSRDLTRAVGITLGAPSDHLAYKRFVSSTEIGADGSRTFNIAYDLSGFLLQNGRETSVTEGEFASGKRANWSPKAEILVRESVSGIIRTFARVPCPHIDAVNDGCLT